MKIEACVTRPTFHERLAHLTGEVSWAFREGYAAYSSPGIAGVHVTRRGRRAIADEASIDGARLIALVMTLSSFWPCSPYDDDPDAQVERNDNAEVLAFWADVRLPALWRVATRSESC